MTASEGVGYRALLDGLMLAVAIAGCAMLVVAPLLAELSRAFDVSLARAGLLPAFHGAALAVCAPLVGLTARRLPRTTLIVIGLAVQAAAWMLAALTSSFATLLGAAALIGASTGLVLPPAYASAGDLAASGAGPSATRRIVAGWSIAFLLVLPFNAYAQAVGWRMAFVTLAVMALTVAGAIALARKPTAAPVTSAASGGVLAALRRVFGHSPTRRVLLTNVIDMGGYFAVYTFLGSELRRANDWGPSGAGLVLAAYGLGLTVISFGTTRVLRHGAARVGWIGLLLLAPLLATLPLSVGWPFWSAMQIFLWGMVQGSVFTALTVLANEVQPGERGVIAAMQGAGTYLGVTLFTSVAATVYGSLGFLAVGIASGLSCIVAAFVLRGARIG